MLRMPQSERVLGINRLRVFGESAISVKGHVSKLISAGSDHGLGFFIQRSPLDWPTQGANVAKNHGALRRSRMPRRSLVPLQQFVFLA